MTTLEFVYCSERKEGNQQNEYVYVPKKIYHSKNDN